VSLQDHLQAFTLQHTRRLLLKQLWRDILKFLYAVFQDVVYEHPKVLINFIYVSPNEIGIDKFGFRLFMLLLSQVRLKG